MISITVNLAILLYVFLHEQLRTRRRREALLSLLPPLTEMAVVLDASDRIVYISDSFARFGLQPDRIRGCSWSSLLAAVQSEEMERCLRALVSKPQGVTGPIICDFKAPDGMRVVLQAWGADLSIISERWRALFFQDVTQQTQFQDSMHQLEHLSAVAHLTAGITHNFSNVFASIILHAELLQTARGEEKNRLARRLVEAAQRGGEVCRKLITFAQGEPPCISSVPVERVIKDLFTLIEPQVFRQSASLEIICEPNLMVLADPTQLREILVNLLLNALEASGPKGQVIVHGRRSGRQVAISIANSGPPIPAEQIPVIFLPFFSTKEVTMHGVGMGLAVSRTLAIGMGGALDVANLPGGMTAFTLTLPAAAG
ncbi:MAG: two-component system sensor histidine kinase NtrB [Bacillota bacterium]